MLLLLPSFSTNTSDHIYIYTYRILVRKQEEEDVLLLLVLLSPIHSFSNHHFFNLKTPPKNYPHTGYAQTFEEAYERIQNLYKEEEAGVPHENPPLADFLVWRDLRVFDGKVPYFLLVWRWFFLHFLKTTLISILCSIAFYVLFFCRDPLVLVVH